MECWDALGMDDESLSNENNDSVDSDTKSEDSLVLRGDEEGVAITDLSQDLTFAETTEDYTTEATVLFSTTQIENLKEKAKVLVQRRQHGYYRSKYTH